MLTAIEGLRKLLGIIDASDVRREGGREGGKEGRKKARKEK